VSVIVCNIDETMMGDEPMNLPRPKPPKKKDIQYGPAPEHMVEAVRKELLRLVKLRDLDANLGTISRFASQSDDMLMSLKSPIAVMRGEHEITVPGVTDSPNGIEAFGATFIRQLIPALSAHQKTAMETPESLTFAIATARRNGMTDVAAALEKKLLGHALDGPRPIEGPLLLPPIAVPEPAAPTAQPGKRSTKSKHVHKDGLNGSTHSTGASA
jgi:hypothetical protein